MCYNPRFAELHATALLSQDPAAYLTRQGLRDIFGDCAKWIAAADVQAVIAGASEANTCEGATPYQVFFGEMIDALKFWEEQTDGFDWEPVRELVRRKLFVAARGVRQ